jgi:hypothetical protein
MAQPIPQVPNQATMTTAITNMNTHVNQIGQSAQAFANDQQTLGAELLLIQNYNGPQQSAAIMAQLQQILQGQRTDRDLSTARYISLVSPLLFARS